LRDKVAIGKREPDGRYCRSHKNFRRLALARLEI
jgi:hypothetical protein